VREIVSKKDNISTTSHDLVLTKNGILITSAKACINVPVNTFTWRIIKYALTTKNDPTILAGTSTSAILLFKVQ
tara:strand:+ start:1567 stop:1788 length:222 start_codon:yes stop_codon:yes gene_type:complete